MDPPHAAPLRPNGRAATPTDGRWQHGAVVPGLYLAEDTATAVAEWYRLLAELGTPPPEQSRTTTTSGD
jgi:RES domain-containing protein